MTAVHAMSYFDLLFFASAPLSLVALMVAAVAALRGRRRARRIVTAWAIYVVCYAAAALTVDYLQPQRVIAIATP